MFPNLKFSIRVSIITLFVLLLSFVGFTIIGINYVTLNKVLSSSAKNLIEQTSLQLRERIHSYLLPLNRDLIEIQSMLNENILDPTNPATFDQFLIEYLRYNPQIYMIYYGTGKGDFYGVGHENNIITLYHIINSSSPPLKIRYDLDAKGKIINKVILSTKFDPRTRPWYQQAIQAKRSIWTDIYKFVNFDDSNVFPPGLTAAVPVFGKNQEIKGVFAMDLTIDGIQQFINQLQMTENSMVYITDQSRQVIAYKNPIHGEDIRGKRISFESVKKFNIPLSVFQFNPEKTVTSFKYRNQEFFLANQPITGSDADQPWHITIIVPAKDILSPLRGLSIHTLLLTLFVLFIGALVARFISQKISNPIILVAKEAKEITQLNLKQRPLLKTRIKEISYLDKSLTNMRSSLISFQRYVPSSLVKKLMKTGKIAEVGGQNQNITVLFSDIKNFTTLAESTSPQHLMLYLSDYFQSMTESVITHQGTLDKYIGDAVMAIWNAPLLDPEHALHTCQSAINMLDRVKELNLKNRQRNLPEFIIRIGIYTGVAVVGNVGSEDRLSFTALGDTVNLANRIEALNKTYHTQIIVGKSTFKQTENQFNYRLLDEVAVRGKQESTTIYELITASDLSNLNQHREDFLKAFTLYQYGKWQESLAIFENLIPAYPNDQLAKVYIERCQSLMKNPPQGWDGIWRITLP